MADKNYSNIPPELKEKLKKIIEEDFTEESSKKKIKKRVTDKDLFITDKQASEGNPGDKELGIVVKPIK
tara:strand:+ start:363 stop:569 length:207 start_codon:yes stop_codon:yes gene_type:complete